MAPRGRAAAAATPSASQPQGVGTVSLAPHARPERLDALELRDCVPSPRGPSYFVTWRG